MESTAIYRLSDNLPLSGSSDDNNTRPLLAAKTQSKKLVNRLGQQQAETPSMGQSDQAVASTVEDKGSDYAIHYYLSKGIAYVCITPANFPKKLVYSYLSEICNEFSHVYGPELGKPALKPYQFMQFDSFISKTKKIYSDSRVQNNMDKLNSDLSDVKMIMNRNIQDMLYRGDSLDKLHDLSQNLKAESKKYRRYAEKINFQLLIKQYAPIAVLALIVLLILYRMIF